MCAKDRGSLLPPLPSRGLHHFCWFGWPLTVCVAPTQRTHMSPLLVNTHRKHILVSLPFCARPTRTHATIPGQHPTSTPPTFSLFDQHAPVSPLLFSTHTAHASMSPCLASTHPCLHHWPMRTPDHMFPAWNLLSISFLYDRFSFDLLQRKIALKCKKRLFQRT